MNEPEVARWHLSIGAVERDTGLSKDTLRVWERRYGFPQPERDQFGERLYPQAQVDKLRLLKRLIDRGHRPGKLVGRSVHELLELASLRARAGDGAPHATIDATSPLAAFDARDVAAMKRQLRETLGRVGLSAFVLDTAAALHQQLSEAWMHGRLTLHEERLCTEALQTTLQGALAALPLVNRPPRVLLGTFPNESRTLGLLMIECLLALEGATCMSLGAQTPILDMVCAARAQRADVVVLHFSAAYPINRALEGLHALREQLPPSTRIWLRSANPAILRRAPADVVPLPRFEIVPATVANWRQTHAAELPPMH